MLADADAVMVTVGQDEFANFKICFQKMQNQGSNIFTIENTGLSNFTEGEPTYPVNGFPPPPPTAS